MISKSLIRDSIYNKLYNFCREVFQPTKYSDRSIKYIYCDDWSKEITIYLDNSVTIEFRITKKLKIGACVKIKKGTNRMNFVSNKEGAKKFILQLVQTYIDY